MDAHVATDRTDRRPDAAPVSTGRSERSATPLAGRAAIVTGGGTGVGLAIATALADAGASVAITGRREAPLRDAADNDPRLAPHALDAADEAAMTALAEWTGATITVANAGAAASAPFHRTDASALEGMMAANLLTAHATFRATLPAMRATGWGRMIAVASTAALTGYPYVTAYCAAKHAVLGMVRALALEMAAKAETRAITANAVCPGYTDTPMLRRTLANISDTTGRSADDAAAPLLALNPQGRFVDPHEVAGTVLWLASPLASAVTGQAISVSGGEVLAG